ncbi:hypothetical protein Avbf_13573 [Armadillidium vulgare]|nr:hypothetical protein Avbf_13573 [Armadillidium vulgare]
MTSHSTPSLPERDLPSTSSGISNSNRNFNAHPTWTPKKRCSSPSSHSGSKRLQSSIALPRPIQRMTLEQIDLVQGQFNIFVAYMMGVTNLNTPNINQTEFDAMKNFLFMNPKFNYLFVKDKVHISISLIISNKTKGFKVYLIDIINSFC